MSEPDIRCTSCGAEFSLDSLGDVEGCPTCGTQGVPMRIEDDVTITINTHELRILCMWADNYIREIDAKHDDNQGVRAVEGIVYRLNKQLPGVPLTMDAEFQQLADTEGTEVTVEHRGKQKVVKPRKPN